MRPTYTRTRSPHLSQAQAWISATWLQDPPYPGLGEKTIAADDPSPPTPGPGISLNGKPSVRLQTRGQP